jgi:glucan biosynthesis protein C
MKERRYDIDWLRVLAILVIFIFHNARFFDSYPWHLKNAEQKLGVLIFVGFVDTWIMPLFFFLSGVGSWYSLEHRSSGRYLLERVLRLLVPLYTVGIFILLPPQLYWDRLTNGRFTGSFWQFYPEFFKSFDFDVFAPFVLPWSGHLWFLFFLFTVSLLSLPIMIFLKSESGRRSLSRLAGWCNMRGGIFLFVPPLFLLRAGLQGLFRGDHTLADMFCYMLFFLLGYILPADERFTESLKRHAWICLPLGLACFAAEGGLIFGLGYQAFTDQGFSQFRLYLLLQLAMSVQSLCWIVFFVGTGAKYLHFQNSLLAYCNEAVLPFYILHQTLILFVGSYVVKWNMGIAPKYLIISVTSFVLIMAAYELLIRPFNPVRFLFGMKTKKTRRLLSFRT